MALSFGRGKRFFAGRCILSYLFAVAGGNASELLFMVLQILLDEAHIVIYYDHLNDWLFVDWHGPRDLTSIQHGALEMLRLLV